MIHRRRAAIAAAVFAAAALAALPVAAAAQSAEPPRTAWGAPDLGGVWDFRTTTPLERPDEEARAELTAEEAASRTQQASEQLVDREPPPGDPGGYNVFWVDTPAELLDQRTSLIVDPPDGKLPALVDGAVNQVGSLAEDTPVDGPVRFRAGGAGTEGPEARGLAERCLLGFAHGPPLTPGGYNQNVQVFQTPDHVVILNEMVHDPRIVPLDGRPRLPDDLKQWNGDARGYWEGDTLVIESTNFTHLTASFNPNAMVAIGSADTLRLTERLTRVNDEVLRYEYTVDDPKAFARPFTAAIPMRKSEVPIFEYACHEGNYGMLNILRGAREDERSAAAQNP